MEVQLVTFAASTVEIDRMKFLYGKVWKAILFVFYLIASDACSYGCSFLVPEPSRKTKGWGEVRRYRDVNQNEIS